MILSPLKVVIEDNTRVIEQAVTEIKNLDARVNFLDRRVVKIETVHEMESK